MSQFTEEQLNELATIFGLKRNKDVLPVRDGVVTREERVWWRCATGPEHVQASAHWGNIRNFPELYQVTEPHVANITYAE
jgi:hypothetical protein